MIIISVIVVGADSTSTTSARTNIITMVATTTMTMTKSITGIAAAHRQMSR